jgi:hypothetical protein
VEQAVGEDVSAFAVGGELHFVDRHEGKVGMDRHRLDRAQQVARILGLDALLAGDQRDLIRPLDGADALIDLARQQPQRKADRARGMAAKPLDGEVRLAGIGRAKHGNELAGFVAATGG